MSSLSFLRRGTAHAHALTLVHAHSLTLVAHAMDIRPLGFPSLTTSHLSGTPCFYRIIEAI